MVSLASSVHAGPRTFALLVGSGISASAGVPSGRELMVDLVRRLALLHREDAEPDLMTWYRQRFGSEPDYSGVLAQLAPSEGDRRNLLASFFVPTEQDREEGQKVPTRAHHAIAALVAGGSVRVIVTTNFDRLLEAALADAETDPIVVSSPDHASGALPVTHSPCTIIKVHGDYLSTELKNTQQELATFDESIDRLLDEVFDQYGLVVCGWSGSSDTALRRAILRAPSRRFATYWMHRGNIAPEAEEIITHRSAIAVQIPDADTAMEELVEMVRALSEAVDQSPVDTAVAVSRLKRYLSDPTHRIRLRDLVIGETDAVIDQIRDLPMATPPDRQGYTDQMARYEHAAATLMQLLAVGAFFSDHDDHDQLWVQRIDRLAARPLQRSCNPALLEMQQYPTLLAMYALGVGAFAAGRINPIVRVLAEVSVGEDSYSAPIAFAVNDGTVLGKTMEALHGLERLANRGADRLLGVLRPVMSDIAPEPERQEDVFDQVTYLIGIAYVAHFGRVGPAPRVTRPSYRTGRSPRTSVERHSRVLVDAGLFNSNENLAATGNAYCEQLQQEFPALFNWFPI